MKFICLLLVVWTLHSASEVECGPGVDLFLDSVETNKLMGEFTVKLLFILDSDTDSFVFRSICPVVFDSEWLGE